jgi:hypothetical protein
VWKILFLLGCQILDCGCQLRFRSFANSASLVLIYGSPLIRSAFYPSFQGVVFALSDQLCRSCE